MDRHVQTSCLDILFSGFNFNHDISFFIESPLLSACRKTHHSVNELDTCNTEYCEGNYTFHHVDTNAKSPGEIPEGCEVKLDHVNWFRNQSTKLFEFRQINIKTIPNKVQFMP
uniref:Uncharacterized protein n=1 Tax=Salix viminalis TaxID=40686 RepID=A0A6N2KUL3_SALVM